MAKIVMGLGTSHSPMLLTDDEDIGRYEDWYRIVGLLDLDGKPTTHDTQFAANAKRLAPRVTGEALMAQQKAIRAAKARIQDAVAKADLDLMIIVGDDQDEQYKSDNRPALAVYCGATIANRPFSANPGLPPWFFKTVSRYFEPESPRDYPVNQAFAGHLIRELIRLEFDVASSDRLQEGKGEGHFLAYIHRHVMNPENPIPVLPVALNTYFQPNQPTPKRCVALGRAIATAVASFPEDLRVGVVASGGLSHFMVDEAFDRQILSALGKHDLDALAALPLNKLNSGSSEIRNWICMAGAIGGLELQWSDYVPAMRSAAGAGTGLAFAVWQ